jgi:hypothetical protein
MKGLTTVPEPTTTSVTSRAPSSTIRVGKNMTPQEKKYGLIHVRYEMRRLKECYHRWRALRPGACSQSDVNDLIELTLLHARAILDFFEYGRGHTKIRSRAALKDDIVSEDYGWPAKAIPIDQKIKTAG